MAGSIPWYQGILLSFSEAIRSELKDNNVTVTALLPGATDTDFFNKADMNASKIVQEGDMASAEDVAKDGYDALMAGKDKITSGFKNKIMVGMSHILPDTMVADQMKKQQGPANG